MVDYLIATFAQSIPMSILGLVGGFIFRSNGYWATIIGAALGGLPALILFGSLSTLALFSGLLGGLSGFTFSKLVKRQKDAPKRNTKHESLSRDLSESSEDKSIKKNQPHAPSMTSESSREPEIDDVIYEEIALEIERGEKLKGLWTRLWVESNGDENKTTVEYIKARFAQKKSERSTSFRSAQPIETSSVSTNSSEDQDSDRDADLLNDAEKAYLAAEEAESNNPFREFGLSIEDVEYLGRPIRASKYVSKHSMTNDKLEKAISLGKLKAMWIGKTLWVEDKKFLH